MDWEVDDLALCIEDPSGCSVCGDRRSIKGKVYTVSGIGERLFTTGVAPYLLFADAPNEHRCNGNGWTFGHMPTRFIKLNGLEADAFDREVIEALTGEPVHVPQHDALHNSCQCEVLTCADAEQVRQ